MWRSATERSRVNACAAHRRRSYGDAKCDTDAVALRVLGHLCPGKGRHPSLLCRLHLDSSGHSGRVERAPPDGVRLSGLRPRCVPVSKSNSFQSANRDGTSLGYDGHHTTARSQHCEVTRLPGTRRATARHLRRVGACTAQRVCSCLGLHPAAHTSRALSQGIRPSGALREPARSQRLGGRTPKVGVPYGWERAAGASAGRRLAI